MATDLDGNSVDTHSEAWRHACEVRHVARMSERARTEFCAGVADCRGREPAKRLYRDALAYIAAHPVEIAEAA
jgi:hypothetical protein